MPLSDTSVAVTLKGTLSNALDLQTVTTALNYGKSVAWSNGTGNGQADKLWTDQRTLTASANEDLDLAGGLTDAFGAAITFARIKMILVVAAAANTNNVVIGAAASNAFVGPFGAATHTIHVRPDGMAVLACKDATGWAVTGGTGDLLRVANSAGSTSVTYDIAILGASA